MESVLYLGDDVKVYLVWSMPTYSDQPAAFVVGIWADRTKAQSYIDLFQPESPRLYRIQERLVIF